MATAISGGPQLTRSIERVLEDAQHTGVLNITGRKLKEFPKVASKYDLSDTVLAGLYITVCAKTGLREWSLNSAQARV